MSELLEQRRGTRAGHDNLEGAERARRVGVWYIGISEPHGDMQKL